MEVEKVHVPSQVFGSLKKNDDEEEEDAGGEWGDDKKKMMKTVTEIARVY